MPAPARPATLTPYPLEAGISVAMLGASWRVDSWDIGILVASLLVLAVPVFRLWRRNLLPGARQAPASDPPDPDRIHQASLDPDQIDEDRMHRDQKILERLRASQLEVETINRIQHVFLTARDEDMCAQVLAVVLDALDSPYGVFGYLDENGDWVAPTMTREVWSKCRMPDKRVVFPRSTWGDSSWPRALREKRTICHNQPSVLVPDGHIPITRHVSLPLVHHDEAVGLIQVANKQSDYTAADLALLEALGRSIAPVLEARLQRDRMEKSRQKAEEARAQLARAVEQAAETVVITDLDGNITYVNPAFEKTSLYSRQEALGQNPRLLKSGAQDREFYGAMWATLTQGRAWSGRFINRKKNGELFEEEATISPIADDSGQVVSYVAVKRDVTHEASIEAQLHQAQKMESVGRLAGGVAHDFNNLLTVIIGYGELLLSRLPPDDPLREFSGEILKSAERATGLTQQLLAFSRRQMVQECVLDLNVVVRDTEKMLRRVLGEEIELEVTLESELGRMKGDVGQLTQVLMNLAVNARDAMPEGGRLHIGTANIVIGESPARGYEEIKPGHYVRLVVRDSGMGMDEETKSRIFEPFFTTKKPGEGTGLGLATVYGIVTHSGGSIKVHSAVARGTSFEIYFPRVEEELTVEEPRAQADSLGGSDTILLVEDQEELRKLAELVLSRYGYQVLEATNAAEALRKAKDHPGQIDLLLTDVVLPGMNGRELAERLKPLRPGIKVLYTSGYSHDVISHRGILQEGEDYLPKPFTPEALARKVAAVLRPAHPDGAILVVDDDPGIRSLLRQALEGEGFEVFEAGDGKNAVLQAAALNLDLVITDLSMPDQEGLETIQQLRREKPDQLIIAISGAFHGDFLKVAKMFGAKATLPKPIRMDQLLETVRMVLLENRKC